MGWISLAETSKRLGRTRQRVHQLLQIERLRGALVDGRWLVDPASVVAWIAEQCAVAASRAATDLDALPDELSILDAARLLKITPTRVAVLVRNQQLPASCRGRRRWIHRADFQAFVAERERKRSK